MDEPTPNSRRDSLESHSNEPRTILVTGASTGIGRDLAERLSDLGHRVWASARKPSDLESLSRLPGVIPLPLDVRDPESVRSARKRVEERGGGLDGLVNNAGVGGLGPLAGWTEPELRDIFEVNLFGPMRMIREFLPPLLARGGRIVNIGSQGGSISMRYYAPYTMTKHALEALTVSMRDELGPHGIHVSIVQPGGVITAIGENSLDSDIARFRRAPVPFDRESKEVVDALLANPEPREEEPESAENRKPSSPQIVTAAVLDALFSPAPRARYLVGTRWEGRRVVNALIERLLDANDCPSLSYPRSELIAMLEAAARTREAIAPSSRTPE